MRSTIGIWHLELLAQMFKHVMTQEQRHKCMTEIPQAYNALVGETIVVVKKANGEEP